MYYRQIHRFHYAVKLTAGVDELKPEGYTFCNFIYAPKSVNSIA